MVLKILAGMLLSVGLWAQIVTPPPGGGSGGGTGTTPIAVTFNTGAGTCSVTQGSGSCTAASTGYTISGVSTFPGVTITDNYGSGVARIVSGVETSTGLQWGSGGSGASIGAICQAATCGGTNSIVLVPFTAAATGTLVDTLPGMGATGAAGTNGTNGATGATGATGNQVCSSYGTVTDASPIAWTVTNPCGTVTLNHVTATRALNLTGLSAGNFYTLKIIQDSTGGAAMTLGSGCTWKVVSGGAGAVTLTATANAIDVLAFTYDGTNCLANIGKNYN